MWFSEDVWLFKTIDNKMIENGIYTIVSILNMQFDKRCFINKKRIELRHYVLLSCSLPLIDNSETL